MVVDRPRVEHSDDPVLEEHEDHPDQERHPLLIEAQERNNHEVFEMRFDRASGQ